MSISYPNGSFCQTNCKTIHKLCPRLTVKDKWAVLNYLVTPPKETLYLIGVWAVHLQ